LAFKDKAQTKKVPLGYMKLPFLLCCSLLVFLNNTLISKQTPFDSLQKLIAAPIPDTEKVMLYIRLSNLTIDTSAEAAIRYATLALDLAKKSRHEVGIVNSYYRRAQGYHKLAKYKLALDDYFVLMRLPAMKKHLRMLGGYMVQ